MAWDAADTVQLIGVLVSVIGILTAWYKCRRIMAASHWLAGKIPLLNVECLSIHITDIVKLKLGFFVLKKLRQRSNKRLTLWNCAHGIIRM
jgi:hypothetical protein